MLLKVKSLYTLETLQMLLGCAEIPVISRAPFVLVAGAPLVGKSRLCQEIVGLKDPPTAACTSWTVQTKYYKANVDLCEGSVNPNNTSSSPEALILVFSLAEPSTFNWAQSFCERPGLEAVDVKLLCGTHADAIIAFHNNSEDLGAALLPEWFRNAADWSIQNGFEFIICCPEFPALDAVLTIDGDRQGVARVVEALHAHPWPNLVMLQQGPRRSCDDATYEVGCAATRASDDYMTTGLEHSVFSQAKEISERRGSKQCDRQQQLRDSERCEDGQEVECDDEAWEAEHVLDGLGRLMEDLNGHKSRLAALSDHERREQAAALALRMLKVFEFSNDDMSSDEA